MAKAHITIFSLITLIGLVLRVAWVVWVPTQPVFDFATYLQTAANIFNGYGHSLNGNPVAWQGPGFAFLLAFVHTLAGSANPNHALVLNVILSTATLPMLFFVYRRWFWDAWGKVFVAYGITAVFPNLIAYTNVAGTETLFLFLLAALLLAQLYIPASSPYRRAIVMGVLCGLAALTKPFMLAYPVVVFVMWWMQENKLKQTFAFVGLMVGVMLITIAPWSIRNFVQFGRPILISYNAGYVQLVNNNYANLNGMWMPLEAVPVPDELREEIARSLSGGRTIQEAYELEPLLAAQARSWIIRNPRRFTELAFLRVQRTFFTGATDITLWAMNDWDLYGGRTGSFHVNTRHMRATEGLFSIVIVVFSGAGLLFGLLWIWPGIRSFFIGDGLMSEDMVLLHIGFLVAIVAFYEGQERYAHPVIPFFIFALIWLCGKREEDI
jgi:4-amino-4-deoxy-L-arabinose transferase-like glycosyltransferase